MQLENLELLCYNCMFLTTGAPNVVYRQSMEKSLGGQHLKNTRVYDRPTSTADGYERDPALLDEDTPHDILSEEERAQLLQEIEDDVL